MLWVCVKYFLEPSSFSAWLFSLLAVVVIRGAISLVEDLSQWTEKTWVKWTDSTLDDGLLPLVRKVVKTSIVILGVLVILQEWEVQIGPILGALGIGGLAMGLALGDMDGDLDMKATRSS